jgi:hypothetical protein
MIWLRDLDVQVEPASDGRTARVTVCDNDADASGEKPPIGGAEVRVYAPQRTVIADQHRGRPVPASPASPPADLPGEAILLAVHHPGSIPDICD